ncbi:hypothetical protein N7462_006982 [Penicillium macrosclerotiorum]|uniref:uncharacterized protein n=1 Tax=Penicillium macrosclerotiorum TaxID=303699 RepID=UPI0025466324|nr:uncharacterized protein N7462_006982 [Penicillium macrosclerotiorum]KAJ5678738.1 hypothetical protein N7462_006982 [Penicillium macrosclerotiorum]
MASDPYVLPEILAIANIHPFYVSNIKYPPDTKTVKAAIECVKRDTEKVALSPQNLLRKKDLYHVIDRLVNDLSPLNTYRRSCYTSTTGGGSGGTPLFFATDVHENRRHRAHFGKFLRTTRIVEETDWILSVHFVGHLYRSLDLIAEICEMGGASVLGGGPYMSKPEVVSTLINYHVNVLAGESSQIINVVHYISTLSREERDRIHIQKIIYSSEMMTPAQRSFILEIMGTVKIYSIYGSAEAGPWAVGNPDITQGEDPECLQDFIFDTRSMVVEILDPSTTDAGISSTSDPCAMPDGEPGIIVQTSLHRLRNPLVRYVTGDLGSIHLLPETARSMISEADWEYLRVLRLYGRDRRFSFEWDGMYFEFESLAALLSREEYGVLQWQVILDRLDSSPRSTIETRLFRSSHNSSLMSEESLSERIMTFFNAYSGNANRLSVTFLDDRNKFVRSGTGDKIIKFVDRFN